MTKINSHDEALHAIWNPKVNILLLDMGQNKPQPLEEILYTLMFSPSPAKKNTSPAKENKYYLYHLFSISLITKIPEGFLNYPLLQLNILKPKESNAAFEDIMWAEIHAECNPYYKLYGFVGRAYYIGERVRFTKISSVDYTLAVSKSETLLTICNQQSPYCSYLERNLSIIENPPTSS